MAEGVFLHRVSDDARFHVDSAGTGAWHVGEGADPRAQAVARANGVHLPSRARQVRPRDFQEFDVIVAMDDSNLRNLQRMAPAADGAAELRMFREFDPEAHPGDMEVPDPYYGGDDGFDRVFEMVERSADGLLDYLHAHYLGRSPGPDAAG
jgi:protein-tyrosine phosphatase